MGGGEYLIEKKIAIFYFSFWAYVILLGELMQSEKRRQMSPKP
jgi:hypothetical protein